MLATPLHPRAVVFAGPNGSGKSTLTRKLMADPGFPFPANYINADDIARELGAQMPGVAQIEREREAFRRARGLRRTLRKAGESHAFETVFSHPSNLLDLQKLRTAGFFVTLFFVSTANPLFNVARVEARVQEGGHQVDAEKVVSRYERSMSFLPRAVEIVSEAFVYDNSHKLALLAMAEGGVLLPNEPGDPPVPEYLNRRLVVPLAERAASVAELTGLVRKGEAMTPPDEEAGVYEGPIRAATAHHVLQEVGPGALVRHDALLLTAPVTPGTGAVRIAYKDGYGAPTPSPAQ